MVWSKKEQEKRENGRPKKYTDDLALEICRRLSKGESLKKITDDSSMPDDNTVFRWIHGNVNGFRDNYARAKEESADALAEQMLDIVDGADDKNSNAIQKARLRVDTMKWLMSKQKPKRYGDKLDVTTDGKPLPTPIYGGKSGDTTK